MHVNFHSIDFIINLSYTKTAIAIVNFIVLSFLHCLSCVNFLLEIMMMMMMIYLMPYFR